MNLQERARLIHTLVAMIAAFVCFTLVVGIAKADEYTTQYYVNSKTSYPQITANVVRVQSYNRTANVSMGQKVKLSILMPAGLNEYKFRPASNTFQYGVKIGTTPDNVESSSGAMLTLYGSPNTKSSASTVYVYIDNTLGTKAFTLMSSSNMQIYAIDSKSQYDAWCDNECIAGSGGGTEPPTEPPETIDYVDVPYMYLGSDFVMPMVVGVPLGAESKNYTVKAGARSKLYFFLPVGIKEMAFNLNSSSSGDGTMVGVSQSQMEPASNKLWSLYSGAEIKLPFTGKYLYIDNVMGASDYTVNRSSITYVRNMDDNTNYNNWCAANGCIESGEPVEPPVDPPVEPEPQWCVSGCIVR